MLSASTIAFFDQLLFGSLATRDAENRPAIHRAIDVWLVPERKSVGVLLLRHTAGRALPNIENNGCVALAVATSYIGKAMQLKGKNARVRKPTPAEDQRARERTTALGRIVSESFGIPFAFFEQWPLEDGTVVEFEVDAEFDQSPGPGAGRAVGET